MRYLRLLWAYIQRFLLQWMAGRGFVITLVANQAIPPLIGLAVWTTALPDQPQIGTYYVVLLVVQLLTVSYENHTFAGRIYNGELSDDLLRPHPVVLAPLGENVALRIWHLIIGLPLIIGASLFAPVHLAAANVASAIPALVLAALLRFLFTYILALSAFWTQQAHGVTGFGDTLIFLLGGTAAPIALLPGGLRIAGEALPFRAMLSFPVEVAVGSLSQSDVIAGYSLQVGWIVVFAVIAALLWRRGIRRYTAVGG
jgi:ABC-2 type transport system permease protein